MGELKKLAELRAVTQQTLVDFLRADLDLCATFTDLVKTELDYGEMHAAQEVTAKPSGAARRSNVFCRAFEMRR